ncbi:MAG: enoyl-CoA hydratase/isomerase family protein [Gemmatimonadaceae bacterium]|nr:enoyl-CoA hydratase/isomerase family protein [Gemmatimonadaceae bacterium]
MPDHAHLSIGTTGGVRTITLDRPERLNAVNDALAASLTDALYEASQDDAVRVVVITGAGRAFCAGVDLSANPSVPGMTRSQRLDPFAWVGRWVHAVVQCEKPVIAAVNGAAVGAGFGLALACDIRLASDAATFSAGYIRLGLSPDAGVSYFLPRHVGLGRASELLLTGRTVDAAEADRIGLVAARLANETFAAEVASYAARLAAGAPLAQALTKRLLIQSFDHPLDVALRDELTHIKLCVASDDAVTAMAAFRAARGR